MLGLEVCPRSYDVNLKKFIRFEPARILQKKNTFLSNCESMPSFSSSKKMKKLKNMNPIHKLLVKLTIERAADHNLS